MIEMTRKFLDYTKSARLEAADPEMAVQKHAKSDSLEIRMTSTGFPILPKIVMEKALRKGDWDKLLRPFLTQHYCKRKSQFSLYAESES